MTANRLRDLAGRLANGAWVRYWLHWNHPCEQPWLMAISLIEIGQGNIIQERSLDWPDFEQEGFRIEDHDGLRILVVPRTHHDGTAFPAHGYRDSYP